MLTDKEIENIDAYATTMLAQFRKGRTVSGGATIAEMIRECATELSAARARMAELEAKCGRLQAVVDRLPKTADGVPVTPDMIVYGTDEPWIVQEIDNEMCVGFQARDGVGRCPANHLYSTESAALAAKESTNGT